MGLDIILLKPTMVVNNEDFLLVEENPELKEFFTDFIQYRDNSYYDLDKELAKINYKEEDVMWVGTEYGKDVIITFYDKTNVLYEAYTFLNNVWHSLYKNTLEDLLKDKAYIEFKEKYLPVLLKEGWIETYLFYATGSKTNYFNLNSAWKFCEDNITKTIINPEKVIKSEEIIYYNEIGYQRKGANEDFYNDDKWDGPLITTESMLIDYYNKYFNDDFKENIMDKFVEGETAVGFF